jgi:hypothetical protein
MLHAKLLDLLSTENADERVLDNSPPSTLKGYQLFILFSGELA